MSNENLACTYAALILSDAGLATSADNIAKTVAAAGITVRPTLPILFARFLEKKTVNQLFAAAATAAPTASAAAAPAAGAAAPKKVEEKKKVVEEEAEEEMGFGLFD